MSVQCGQFICNSYSQYLMLYLSRGQYNDTLSKSIKMFLNGYNLQCIYPTINYSITYYIPKRILFKVKNNNKR